MSGLSIMSRRPIIMAMDEPPTLVRGFCLRFGYSVVSPRGLSGIWRLGDAAVVCGSPQTWMRFESRTVRTGSI